MSSTPTKATSLARLAIERGLIPPERQDEATQLIASLPPSDAADPSSLVTLRLLTQQQLDALLAVPDASSTPTMPAASDDTQTLIADPSALPRPFGDDFELVALIGQGGMGQVYKAWQKSLRRHVALKLIKPSGILTDEAIQRFHLEAQAAARLRHPNIVSVHHVGVHDGQHFLTMDLVDGSSLKEVLREGKLLLPQRLELLEKVARAIHYAHTQGIVHRDLKPANILIDARGEPLVTDFGLAKDFETDFTLSTIGAVLGTPSYMSPEQAQGRSKEADARSDVYSLGDVLYEMLVGRPPFQADSVAVLLRMIIENEPAPPRRLNGAVPPEVQTICLKCLCKEPDRRYQTAEELGDDIRRYLCGEPIAARTGSTLYLLKKRLRAHRNAVAAVVAVALTIIAVLIWARAVTIVQRRLTPSRSAVERLLDGISDSRAAPNVPDEAHPSEYLMRTTDRFQRKRYILSPCSPARHYKGEVPLIASLDVDGEELWRFEPSGLSPYTRTSEAFRIRGFPCFELGSRFHGVRGEFVRRSVLTQDILPEPGRELMTIWVNDYYAGEIGVHVGRVCILTEEGKLLREMWNPGWLEGMACLDRYRPKRLVFCGRNDHLRPPSFSLDRPYVLFCVQADQIGGQTPPYGASTVPRAKLLWYKAISRRPEWSDVVGPLTGDENAGELQVVTSWGSLYFDGDGNVVRRKRDEGTKLTEPEVVDVLSTIAEDR